MLKVPPPLTSSVPLFGKLPAATASNVPPLTVVPPSKVFTPPMARVPKPLFAKLVPAPTTLVATATARLLVSI